MQQDTQAENPHLFKKQSGMTWARTFYLLGIASALVFVLPVTWFPYQVSKVALFAFFLLLSVISFSASGGWKLFWRSSGAKLALAVGILPALYLLSAFASHTLPFSLLGSGVEADTVVFTALSFFAFLFSFALFRTPRSAWLLLIVVFYSLVAALVFQFITIVGGSSVIPFEAFSDRSVNLIGKWNDLGIIAGLLLLIAVVRLEFSTLSGFRMIGMLVVAVAAVLLMGFVNFSFMWGLLLTVFVMIVLFKLLQSPIAPDDKTQLNWRQHIPWAGITATGVLVIFLFFGTFVNSSLTKFFPVTALEVRPTFPSTLTVIEAERGDSVKKLALGSGPGTFTNIWLAHKPSGVNQSLFWNFDFSTGFSTVVTSLGTTGVFGALAWLVAPLLVVFALLRALRTALLKSRERTLSLVLAATSICMALTYILYVPSQNLILLTFVLMGATFGFLWRSAQRERDMEDVESSRLAVILRSVFALIIIALVFGSTVLVARRALSEVYVLRAQAELGAGQTEAALTRLGTAQWFEPSMSVVLTTMATHYIKLQQVASDTSLPTQTAQQRFAETLTVAISASKEASTIQPNNYQTYQLLGNVYAFLVSLKVPGAYENARTAYQTAATYNPKGPSIPLALARVEAEQGNYKLAEDAVRKALTLKSDYTDAILFVVQLSVAQNDITNAIRAATAAVQTAPGVASIWFQLGILYYTANDMPSAIIALEKALSITPDYANAKYFLGLAYYAQNRAPDAIRLFEDLQKSNPDNSEVSLILSNLRFGKKPFDGAQPPVTPQPEERPTAPITE